MATIKPYVVQKIGVGFLMALFAFSIAPVALLHDAITKHKDACYHNLEQKEKSISKADVNCRCISFVADVHFISSFFPEHLHQPIQATQIRNQFYLSQFYSQHHFFAELRGPPFAA